ncbi:MAM and LDL-receptor class A domain-containing protein 2 isoform X2 [Octopus bimaculoides]|nr:MAM and LDL-receptor class A domain-containing protein 2 isoform X2 [Octopus bimaculoides]
MKIKIYPCQSRHTYLTLLVFAALTVSGHAQNVADVALDPNGLVKVYIGGKWTAICVSGDFIVQSQVLCWSFGQKFSSYSSYRSNLPATITKLTCRGDEKSLSGCNNLLYSGYKCSYNKLHVQCQEDSTKAFCPFDNDICKMVSEGTADYKWQRVHPYRFTRLPGESIPKSDHTTESNKGKYMLASAASFPGQKAILKTKPFVGNISSVSFYYHMFGSDMGSLNVYVRSNNSSEKTIGSLSGNQGVGWKYLCLPIDEGYGHHEVIFEAIQGKGFDSHIALDDVTISENSCSSHWNASCNFERDTCNYNIENSKDIRSGWRLRTNKANEISSSSGNYLQFNSYNTRMRHSISSPMIDIPNEKIKLEFLYYMPGTGTKSLQVRFEEEGLKSWFTKTPYLWQDSGDRGTEWQYGCMDLPSKSGRIVFTGFARDRYSKIGLDDLLVDKGYCRTGITNHVCTFDNPLLCQYEISCMNPNEYIWKRRKGATPSSKTGPSTDNSRKTNGYYMYAEASYGKPNARAELKFLVSNVKGKNLKFAYNMFGNEIGQLYVIFNTSKSLAKLSSSKEVVWTKKGNKGKYWHKACLHIENDISEIIFVAVRGYSYEGDIAIDNVVVEEKGCPGPFDCDFQSKTCKYTVYRSNLPWKTVYQNSDSSDTNIYLNVYSNTNTENAKFQMQSPKADVKENSSITFKYQMRGNMKEFALITYDFYSQNKSWSSNFNDITNLITACVNLPVSTKLGLIFQMTTNINSRGNTYAYLDDIEVHNETCKLGLTYHFCKFKEIHLCNFHVECPVNTRYNWSRGSSSDYRGFPRPRRYSYDSHYYMYVDSINGKPGDKTHLSFPNVVPPAGHSLYFDYYLQQGSGKLQLHLENSEGKKLVFEEFGIIQSRQWNSACIDIKNNTNTSIVFTATRGYEFGAFIGLMNVGFKPEVCQARNISCGFTEGTCQYSNLTYYSTWERINSRNDTNLTDGFFMETKFSYGKSMMVSPTENITNSCVQIRYKIINKNCTLAIYNAFNNNTIFSMVSDDTTPWGIAQMYLQQNTTKLVFQAKSMGYEMCEVLLDYVNIRENYCPQLECPIGTRKCKNNYCYSESKVCDRINDCSDGSDEMNCSSSIACTFKSKYYCGYEILNGWQHELNKHASPFDVSGSMKIIGTKGKMLSPIETLADSCVKFQYISDSDLTGNFSVIWNQWNVTTGILLRQTWNELFFNHKYGSYEGQLQFPAGKGFLEFIADVGSAGLTINNVTVFEGTCPELNCPKNTFKCLDNSKCLNKRYLCNNHWNCNDGSDEKNCSKYFSCDFEDQNMCGFKSFPEKYWFLHTGFSGERPKLDHSERRFSGHYVMSNSSEESYLLFPNITIEDTFCLNFYYTFFGDGKVSVYDNETLLLSLSKFDHDMWRGVNITLPGGSHGIYLEYSDGNNKSGAVALDSVSLIPGRCLHKGCGKDWYPCNNDFTCYPFTAKCDGIQNCPNGEDEKDCIGKKPLYKLVGGRSLLSGTVEKLYGSKYLPVCARVNDNYGLKTICSEFGASVTVTHQIYTAYLRGPYYSCYSKFSFKCSRYRCSGRCSCKSLYLTCSDTVCEDGEVKCPSIRNGSTRKDVCIRRESLCDGEIDCEGGTDEKNCGRCEDEQWQCRNKKCIEKSLRCDGKKDCDDGSDEFHCFSYINETIQVFYNGSYEYICEDNLQNKTEVSQLCSSVGKGYGSFEDPVLENGVLFTPNNSSNMGLIPGFKASSLQKCNVTVLSCKEQVCGARKIDLFEPNIKYGHNALEGKWPWAVQIYRDYRFICTGILISNEIILSAAHCFRSSSYYTYYIRVGTTKKGQGTQYKVDRILKHNNYTNYKNGYDIAILYVRSVIKMTPYVQPVCLPEGPVPRDRDCHITGWGKNESLEFPNILQEAKVFLLDNVLCKKHFSFFKNITVCVNNKEDTQPACHGDSGGPLLCRNTHGKWVAYGVTSYGKPGCGGRKSSPAVYTDIYTFMPWIMRNI